MEIKRFFAEKEDFNNGLVTIKGDEFYHLTIVLRHKVGYKIVVSCDDGYDYNATITELTKDKCIAKIDSKEVNNSMPKTNIHLFQAVIKSAKLDIVIQKAVELGVKSVTLFYSQNTNEKNVNIDRLQKISKEASKQCGRCDQMKVTGVIEFEDMLKSIKNYKNIIIPYEYENKTNFSSLDISSHEDYALIIGSEGGFAEYEVKQVKALGGKSVSLGNRILRAETAGIVASTILMLKLGEFDK